MKPRARVWIVLVAVALLAAAAIGLRSSHAKSAAPAPAASAERAVTVTTAPAVKEDVPVILDGLGTATPLASVMVKTQVDGRLDKVLFTEGQAVKRGDVIALIDSRPFQIQLHQAEAVLARDEAQLKNNDITYKRTAALNKEGLAAQQEVDNASATVGQLEATVLADKTQIANARLNLDYAHITSPIDGVTGVRQVDPGNIVHPSDANGIVVITQIDPMGVIFTLPQDDLMRVQRAMKAGKVNVEAYARDGTQKLASGELLLIDNQVNAQTATIRLKAVVANPEQSLWPNAFVKARMQLETLKGVIVVPAASIQRGPSGTFVYVVGPGAAAEVRPVDVPSVQGERAVVAKGLKEGDIVVTDGQSQLRPGSRVRAKP